MGLIHIYCGSGKGKTTAAIGLAMRAAGSGMRVVIVQFLKGNDTSELYSIKSVPQISIIRCNQNYGFTFNMSDENKAKLIVEHNNILDQVKNIIHNKEVDLLILDEFFSAYNYNLFDKSSADEIVFNKPKELELVLTGRNPPTKYIDAADYVSEINCIKHPYNKGILARKGIEY